MRDGPLPRVEGDPAPYRTETVSLLMPGLGVDQAARLKALPGVECRVHRAKGQTAGAPTLAYCIVDLHEADDLDALIRFITMERLMADPGTWIELRLSLVTESESTGMALPDWAKRLVVEAKVDVGFTFTVV